jgi:hypothetical protein
MVGFEVLFFVEFLCNLIDIFNCMNLTARKASHGATRGSWRR